jgi:predicted kinase
VRGYVLVGGWPASGKTTIARALASGLGVPCLAKDEVKESLTDALGAPATVEQSRRLGVAAVHAVLRVARGCPAAVIDSTWYPYTRPLVHALAGPFAEVRCKVGVQVARERYRRRTRDERHLDGLRTEAELWGSDVPPLGVGPLVEVDTEKAVDTAALLAAVRIALDWEDGAGGQARRIVMSP